MRSIPLLLLSAASLFAVNVNLRSGTGACYVTAITNASPPVGTCSSAHNFTDGQYARLDNALIAGPATHPANRMSYVKVLSPTTFSLWEDSGLTTPLAAPGNLLSNGGADIRIGATVPKTIPASMGPRIYSAETLHDFRCDTSDSCLTNIVVFGGVATANLGATHRFVVGKPIAVLGSATSALNTATGLVTVTGVTSNTVTWNTAAGNNTYTDAAISSRAFATNPAWSALQSKCGAQSIPFYPTDWAQIGQFDACAIWYFIDRTQTTARDKAKWMIQHPEFMALFALAGSQTAFLGDRYSTDSARTGMAIAAGVYNLLRLTGDIDGTLQTEFGAKMLTDKFNTPSCVEQSLSTLTGSSISIASNGAVTGTGTLFTSQLAVGSVIWPTGFGPDDQSSAKSFIVTGITDNTHAQVHRTGLTFTGAPSGYTRPWASGDCGLLWYGMHHTAGPLGNTVLYHGGSEGGLNRRLHNLGNTALYGVVLAATATIGDNSLAPDVLERAMLAGFDNHWAFHISMAGGGTSYGSVYSWWRTWELYQTISVINRVWGIDLRGNWMLSEVRLHPYAYSGAGSGSYFTYYGEDSLAVSPDWVGISMLDLDDSFVTDTQRRTYYAMVKEFCGGTITSSCFAYNSYSGATGFFQGYNPQLDPINLSTLPTATVIHGGDPALCAGSLNCGPGTYDLAISRTGWVGGTSDHKLQVGGGSWTPDHMYDNAGAWWLQLGGAAGVEPAFIGDDFLNSGGSTPIGGKNMVELSGHTRKAGHNVANNSANVSTALFDRWHIESNLFHVRSDSRGAWATAPTRLDSDFMHFKRSGQDEFVVVRRHIIASAGTINVRKHYTLNGEGSENMTTCAGSACPSGTVTGVIRSANATYRVLADEVYPDAAKAGRRYRDNSTGGYSGGNNRTDRHSTCASADGATCNGSATALLMIDVNRIGVVADGTSMTLTAKTATGFDGVQVVGPSGSCALAMFATTSDVAGMPAVSTSTTCDVGVTGLTAGTWKVQKDGSDVSGCGGKVVTSADNAVSCAAVGSGSITVVVDSPPASLTITSTSPLPDVLAGAAYSQALSATGGTLPYTWSISAGSITACGLSMSSAGVITGTATTPQTCSFTAFLLDGGLAVDTKALTITVTAAGTGGSRVGGRTTGGGKLN